MIDRRLNARMTAEEFDLKDSKKLDERIKELEHTLVHDDNKKTRPKSDYEKFDRREKMRKALYAVIAVALLGGNNVPQGRPADAHIGWAAMPLPVEWVVDFDNSSDHQAQGFDAPTHAALVTLEGGNVSIDLDFDYDTRGVPSAYNTEDNDHPNTNELKPGMYAVEVGKSTDKPVQNCEHIIGNFRDAEVTVFTQDKRLGNHEDIVARMQNPGLVEVCNVSGNNLPDGAMLYFYMS